MTNQENLQTDEQYKLKPMWFPVLIDLIYGGDWAKMEGHTAKAYLAIKAYVTVTDGESFPEVEWIAKKSGISEQQVLQSFKSLELLGYLSKEEE